MTEAMRAALRAVDPIIVGLIEIVLPDYELRLLDGGSEIVWGGNKFVGRDAVYGAWISSDSFSDGIGEEAPGLSIQLAPTSAALAGDLTAPAVQDSPVRIWFACVDKATGTVVPDPLLLFEGQLDQPTLNIEKHSLVLDYDLVSAFEGLFLDDEGIRLSDAHHQFVWPGELGLQFMVATSRQIIWGPGDRPPGISFAAQPSVMAESVRAYVRSAGL